MSRGGTTLIPLLNTGSQSFKDMGAEAERLGIILSKDQAEKLDNYGDNVQKLQKTLGGLSNSIVVALVPSLNEIVLGLKDFVVANKELIKTNISTFIKDFGSGLRAVWNGLKTVISAISPFITAIGGIKTVIIALASIYIATLVISLAKVVIAVGAAAKAFAMFSVVLLANPFGLVISALALIAFGAYKLYTTFPQVQKAVQNFGAALLAPFKAFLTILQFVIDGINKVKSVLSSLPSPNINIGLQTQALGNSPRFAPASGSLQTAAPAASAGLANTAVQSRFGNLLPQQQKQKLDISMKIDAEGRAKDVKASSNAPIDFKANTGVLNP
jgi:hypothetical protein